jgi:hypothetical protein
VAPLRVGARRRGVVPRGRRMGAGLDAPTMTTAWAEGKVGCGQPRCLARLTPKLLILRLTTRGNARSRRVGSSRSAISRLTRVSVLAAGSGGNGRLAGGADLAADDAQTANKGEPVGVEVIVQGGLVHQPPDGVVDQQHAPDLLGDHLGGLGAQHHLGAALVGLELIQGGLKFPALLVQRRQFGGGCPGRVKDRGQQPDRGGLGWPAGVLAEGVLFASARAARAEGADDLHPYWVFPGPSHIERHVLTYPLSRDVIRWEQLQELLALYRLAFGQPRQDDMVALLARRGLRDDAERVAELGLDLRPEKT